MIDMYRGIAFQHGQFMTPFLRKRGPGPQARQAKSAWAASSRVVHETTKPRPRPALSKATQPPELVGYLSNANGWHRDMAQQLPRRARNDLSVVPELKNLAKTGSGCSGRLHYASGRLKGSISWSIELLL